MKRDDVENSVDDILARLSKIEDKIFECTARINIDTRHIKRLQEEAKELRNILNERQVIDKRRITTNTLHKSVYRK